MAEPIWRPSQRRIDAANLTAFMRAVSRESRASLSDYADLYRWSIEAPEAFWQNLWSFAGIIGERRGSVAIQDGDRLPGARWFPDAKLNFAANLLRDRAGTDAPALIFRGEDRSTRQLSFAELYRQVSQLRRALREWGVEPGDRVAAYLPNLPETVVAMLAATSLGAIWSSCSPDFGVRGVVDRFGQIDPVVLFATDGYWYGGKWCDTTMRTEEIRRELDSLRRVVVVPYAGEGGDRGEVADSVRYHDAISSHSLNSLSSPSSPSSPDAIEFELFPFDHPLYILYSSGTTGAPKCIVHGAGGTLLQHVKEHLLHVDVKPGDRLFYFTTCGWMMWNWLVSGLASEATLMLYDGSPFHPDETALFDFAESEQIRIFGTSAKFIDAIAKAKLDPARSHDLSKLSTILSTGSPLVAESYDFVYEHIKPDVLLSSISGGTDIVAAFVAGNPIGPVWRGEIQVRGLATRVEVYDESGRPVRGQKGELVCTAPIPSMPLGFWNDPDGSRYHAAYFERFSGAWCQGDFAELTARDGIIIYGRSDAVLNPGGVRIGTAEIYRQVERIDEVLESLVVGQEWQSDVRVVLFVRLREGVALDEELTRRIQNQVRENASPRHVPARVIAVADIPRTRNGKLVELAVRDIIHGRPVANREALSNPEALELFANLPELEI